MATVGIAAEDQGLVVDQFTATLGEDRRAAGETRPLLLVAFGRGHLSRRLFASMLRMIAALPLPDG